MPGARLRVRIRLFAVQRELAGTREVPVDLSPGATVEDAWTALVALHPALSPGRPSVRFAVNGEYAGPEAPLTDGDEVAMIPPVSGGADDAGADDAGADDADPEDADDAGQPRRILELRAEPFGNGILDELARRLASPEDGAIVGFLGVTRRTPGTPAPGQETEAARHEGRSVEALDYEALEPMALRILGEIANEIRARFAVQRLAIVHRTGEVPLGDASVAIVACAPHRAAAFAAAAYAIDETKARAPIWKAERFADGYVWIGAPAREGPRGG
ncbi:MAG: MoaD family protein [Thermoleophilia bacterium]|nr:molybdopterin converting factor [Anaerolinea sp.]MBY0397032.1 MoaD family protein [Thermoleophilia bacterium]